MPKKQRKQIGTGVWNSLLSAQVLPEIHMKLPKGMSGEIVPGGQFNNDGSKKRATYSYCGPNTRFSERVEQSYIGVNKLDRLARVHDELYGLYTTTAERNFADSWFNNKVTELIVAPDTQDYERNDAKKVLMAIGAKDYFGMGIK